jgi:hypothetical protein
MPPLKFCDPSVPLPKLHVLAVNQSHGAVLSVTFVRAMQVYATEDMAVRPNDVGAILLHVRTRISGQFRLREQGTRVKMLENRLCSREGTQDE